MGEKSWLRATDPTLDFLKETTLAIDWENYLAIAYLGNPPEELDAEGEAELMAILKVAAEAQFISRVTCEDRRLLNDMLIRIEEHYDVE
jgi:hypothetical protein